MTRLEAISLAIAILALVISIYGTAIVIRARHRIAACERERQAVLNALPQAVEQAVNNDLHHRRFGLAPFLRRR